MSDEKPVALLLTPVLPLPTGSGRALRAWDWLQTLVKGYRVHVLALEESSDCVKIPENYPAEAVWAIGAKLSAPKFLRAIGLLLPFLSPWFRNTVIDWFELPRAAPILYELETCLARESVRRIVVFRLYMHNIALEVSGRFPEAVMDLDMDDHESLSRLSIAGSLARMKRYRRAAREFLSAVQYGFIERFMCGPYRTVYLSSEADSRRFPTRLAGAVTYRPNRVNVPEDFPPAQAQKPLNLLFVGALSYPPNEEAVRFVVMRLAPELRERLTQPWKLCVIGRHPSTEVARLMESARHVEFMPDDHNLEKRYAAAHIVLVPLLSGGGTKFKTLEGFAHRRPLVSTHHGMRGLGAVAGKHFLLAETPIEFALAILRLAHDQTLADRIAEAGWTLCRERFRIE